MRVKTAQLIPNCILTDDIFGKSGYPLVPKNTVLTEQHILFLDKFLIKDVGVSSKLADGSIFNPIKMDEKAETETKNQDPFDFKMALNLTFKEHYLLVVQAFKEEFIKWNRQSTIDILTIRHMIIPLFERIERAGLNLFFLHHHANKQDYISHHSVSVGLLSAYIAKRMGLTKKESVQVGLAGLLSDSGLSKIDSIIIQNSIPLFEPKSDIVKRHPTFSYRLLEPETTVSQDLKLAVLQHHERLDGSGFPLGLKSEKIHLYARIIAVCDEYHAISCHHLFQKQPSPFYVIKRLMDGRFTKLDPMVVQTILQTVASLAIGINVKLSDGQVGKIIFIDEKNPLHPMVQLEDNQKIISLDNERKLYITDLLLN